MGLPGGGAGRSRRGLRISGFSRNSARSLSASRTWASAAGSAGRLALSSPRSRVSRATRAARTSGEVSGARGEIHHGVEHLALRDAPQRRHAAARRPAARPRSPRRGARAVRRGSGRRGPRRARGAPRARVEQRIHDEAREDPRRRPDGRRRRARRGGELLAALGRVVGRRDENGQDVVGDVEVLRLERGEQEIRAPPSACRREPRRRGVWPSPATALAWYWPPTNCCAA